jgi:hypothetical protein
MNRINIAGYVVGEPTYSHEVLGEKFYEFYIASKRMSDVHDVLPCRISQLYVEKIKENGEIAIVGEVRTRNVQGDTKNKLEIYIFVTNVAENKGIHYNEMSVDGYICRKSDIRKTPVSDRYILDFLLASNRKVGKSDYIPCICWGRIAERLDNYSIGTNISALGRLQSREYNKLLDNGEVETRVAYEFSINTAKEI